MPLQFSEAIERKKLSAISGGGGGQNPLKLATPISYCGGPALATKDNVVAHITLKEMQNLPPPKSHTDDFVLWRISSSSSKQLPRDFLSIASRNAQNEYTHQSGIPLFWEPKKQKKKETKVMYAGHWKLKGFKVEQRVILAQTRCGSLTFSFDHFDENFANVIAKASMMTVKEILEYDFDAMLKEPIKVEDPSPQKRSRENDSDTSDASRATKRSNEVKAEESVATVMDESVATVLCENTHDDGDSKPAARAATPPLQGKTLKDYTSDEISDLVHSKGLKFHDFANKLKTADIRGNLIAEELAKGDNAFLIFLKDDLGFDEEPIYRVSVRESFKDVL
jgi:preprotein translocase subunit SecB